MPDYDKMSVHDLVEVLLDYVNSGAGWYTNGDETPAIESALRRAVLREATVGEVKVVTTEHFDEIARPEDTERIVTMSEQIISKTWVPEGEYVLCKKEGGMNKRYLKVLDADNRSCNGGSTGLEWSLPVQNADGSWTPGKWMPEVTGDLELCANGYHLTDTEHLLDWLNATIYEAEPSEERIESDDKIVCRSVRLLRKMHWDDRVARLFACDCAERVLPIYEKDYPKDKRPRQAIEVARRYAEGKASDSELAAARDAALAAVVDAARDAARAAAGAAARDAARAAAWAAAGDAAGDKEHKWQVKRLMWYLGDECGKVIKEAQHGNQG